MTTHRWATITMSFLLVAAATGAAEAAGARIAVPHGGGSPRGFAPSHGGTGVVRAGHAVPHGGGAPRGGVPAHGGGTAYRGTVPGHGTANGTAHWGYGHGGYYPYYPYYGWGYPYWGGWYPYWSVGFYGSWGYPYYGYYPYGSYGPYDNTYYMSANVPPQTPATIITRVAPTHAEVLVDGQSVGYAKDYNGRWDELTVPSGRHTVTFKSEGYKTLDVQVDLHPGGRYVFDDTLEPGSGEVHRDLAAQSESAAEAMPQGGAPAGGAPTVESQVAHGRLKISAQPDDAAVYLDGEYLGTAGELSRLHGAIPVATGSHRLEVVRPGFASVTRTVEVSGTETTSFSLSLERAP